MHDPQEPENIARAVMDRCTDCDVCRDLMDVNCLLFPNLFRLFDEEKEGGRAVQADDLRQMIDLCNFCALCPCPNIRSEIMAAKAAFTRRDGLSPGVRFLEDVALVGKVCGTFPGVSNTLLNTSYLGGKIKQICGIHADRKLPEFPVESFSRWAAGQGLERRPAAGKGPRVAYFSGCTANYIFPEVAKSAVSVMAAMGISVWYPPQQCCGMPAYLEGDEKLTLKFVGSNMEQLCAAVDDGFEIVCSCPTCGFMFKNLLKSGAYYSTAYQLAVGAQPDVILKPENGGPGDRPQRFARYNKSIYGKILVDEGVFSGIDALKRIKAADNVFDLGEYILKKHRKGKHVFPDQNCPGKMVYFPPCHQREQDMGMPYLEILSDIYGDAIAPVGGGLHCCGMAGIMGFKEEFHEKSRLLGKDLMEILKAADPDLIVTDCLSCSLQFRQFTPYRVKHPIELLDDSV